MLWLAMHLPMFALEVNQAGQQARAPTVLVDGNRVVLGNEAARRAGIGLQSTLTTAHGICPSLIHYRRDPDRELKHLRLLAGMCYRFTSRVSLEPAGGAQIASGLLLEAEGSLKLFGSLNAWQSGVAGLCGDLGHAAVLRAAATPSAALALARARASRLPDVPLIHTGLAGREVESLSNMGIKTLGPLLQLPEAELGQRFGIRLTNYLRRLAGSMPDPRRCIEPEPAFASSLHLLDPITDKGALLFSMQRLLTELEHWLIGRQLGAQRLLWRFAPHEAAARVTIPVRFAAARQRKADFIEIVRLALNRIELPENVLDIGLEAKSLVPWASRCQTLFEPPPGQPGEQTAPTELIDRFTAHLGETGCSGIATTGQHAPEQAWQRCRTGEAGASGDGSSRADRPLWFFDSPRRVDREQLEILRGPERLQTGWWRVDEGSLSAKGAASRSATGSLHAEGAPSRSPGGPLHASPEPGAPGRGRASNNNGRLWDESGCEVRASGTFKAVQRAPEPSTARSLSVPEDRTSYPLGAREAHIGKELFHERGTPSRSRAELLHARGTPSRSPAELLHARGTPSRSPAELLHARGTPSRSPAEGSCHRDYYVVRCGNGARGWAFVDQDGQWFLHGYFG